MAEIKWILTCNMECEGDDWGIGCPQKCIHSTWEKEQINTEVPSDG